MKQCGSSKLKRCIKAWILRTHNDHGRRFAFPGCNRGVRISRRLIVQNYVKLWKWSSLKSQTIASRANTSVQISGFASNAEIEVVEEQCIDMECDITPLPPRIFRMKLCSNPFRLISGVTNVKDGLGASVMPLKWQELASLLIS